MSYFSRLHMQLFVCRIFPRGGVKWKDAEIKIFENRRNLMRTRDNYRRSGYFHAASVRFSHTSG